MAIETLVPGKLPEDVLFVGTCGHCAARFKWSLADSEYTYRVREQSQITCLTAGCSTKVIGLPVEVKR